MATKVQPYGVVNAELDRADRSKNSVAYIGDAAPDGGAVTRLTITAAYQDAFALNAAIDAVLDLQHYDTAWLLVDYVKSAGTDLRIKVSFGETDDRTKLTAQESRDDNGFPGIVKHELIEHSLAATIRILIEIPRVLRFAKVEVKSSGAPDANDKVAVSVFGQNRG